MKKIIAAVISAMICISPSYAAGKETDTADQTPPPLKVSARYYEAFDTASGQKLIGSRENEKMYPASITKVLFTEVLLDRLANEGKNVSSEAGTVTSKDNEKAAAAGLYRSGLRAGEKVTWEDLLHSIIYMSGAEACYAAVRAAFGTEDKAVEEMNRKAAMLGMKSSHFVNVTGRHSADHYTTCSDFVKVMQAAWRNSILHGIFTSPSYTTSNGRHTFVSPTMRAAREGGSELIGGKTGTTDAAQHTFAGFAESDKHIIAIIVGLCPLNVANSNIKDAGTIANYINSNYVLQKIPETFISDGTTYTPQTKGQVLLPKGRCVTFARDGSIVMKSGGREAVIQATAVKNVPGTEISEKKENTKKSVRKDHGKENGEKGIIKTLVNIIKAIKKFLKPILPLAMTHIFGN